MKDKIIKNILRIKPIATSLFVAGMVGSIAASASSGSQTNVNLNVLKLTQSTDIRLLREKQSVSPYRTPNQRLTQNLYFEKNKHEGTKRYIVRLVDTAAASYTGGVSGYKATNLSAKSKSNGKSKKTTFNAKSSETKSYVRYLSQKQSALALKASIKLGVRLNIIKSYKYAVNAILTELTYDEATKVANLPGVAFVEQDVLTPLNTDTGPLLIGAGNVWDGSAAGTPFLGEGVVIGMLDTGVNTDHRSFAATGDDGYTVVNPLGNGNFIGDCVADASLCNAKLIGVRSYPAITGVYADPIFAGDTRPATGEDYNGHGSHTSSTAGGNILDGVPFVESDLLGGNTGDGLVTPFIYPRMSGVAPHANIISYQVCLPGNAGDTFGGCSGSATLAAIDDAINDNVDVLNYSIGGTVPFNPWSGSVEIAFLNARNAGIFVATSAGNSGPEAFTTTKASPWYTSVAAATHGNSFVVSDGMTVGSLSGGSTAAPADISGEGLNGGFTGDIVWAGDFTNTNDPDGAPEQCLQPFPANTFLATQIVVCDRGAIARVQKAANAAAGGAGGFVLANVQGGANTTPGDFYVIPGIHIDADDGDVLRTWLASGSAHQGSISVANLIRSTNTADEIANFSSRGPNNFVQLITPQITAPGHRIYAAWADEQPFFDGSLPNPKDFNTISGTSMASPHIAGAAALVTQAQPTWNPDQIRSALMMTSTTAVTKNDDGNGSVNADLWDRGAGRVQVDAAVNAGLVMSETGANYLAADPDNGGDPRTLNIPSLANFACASTCTWTRTFTAVTAGTYNLISSDSLLTIQPSTITAVAGMDYSVEFNFNVLTINTGEERFEEVSITSTGTPDLHLPVYVKVNNGSVPDSVDIKTGRNNGSIRVTGIQSVTTDSLVIEFNGLFDPNATGALEVSDFSLTEDTNTDPFDGSDGVFRFEFTVAPSSQAINVSISESTAPDNDLYLLFDSDGDGEVDTIAASQADGATNESVSLANPAPGVYVALVQNFAASSVGATDTGKLTVEVVPQSDPLPGMTVQAPTSADGVNPPEVSLLWDMELAVGDFFVGEISVSTDEILIGTFPVSIERVEDDISLAATTTGPITRGDAVDYLIRINPSLYSDDVAYSLDVDLPPGSSMVSGSFSATRGNGTIKDPNAEEINLSTDFDIAEDPTNDFYDDDLSQVFVFEFEVPVAITNAVLTISNSTSPDNDLYLEVKNGDGTYSLIARAATPAANESLSFASPAAGTYRAIVQNWAGSSAATDTGTLSIVLLPATGEGFLWGGAASVPTIPTYSVVTSVDSAECAVAGLTNFSGSTGYVPLSAFGIGTVGASGDDSTFGVFADDVFTFFGEEYVGTNINTNGIMIYGGTPSRTFDNQPIPNPNDTNNLLAALWSDQVVVDDGSRGVRLADGGPMRFIEVTDAESIADPSVLYTYQITLLTDEDSDDHAGFGPFEIVVDYPNNQGTLDNVTAGVENIDASRGVDSTSLLQTAGGGIKLCYDAVFTEDVIEIRFSVLTSAESGGQQYSPIVGVETDLINAQLSTLVDPVEMVNVGPSADAGEDFTVDRDDASVPDIIELNAGGSFDIDDDVLFYQWTQISGAKQLDLLGSHLNNTSFVTKTAPPDVYTFKVLLNDGEFSSEDTITVTVIGKDGGGGMGLLLLILGLPLYYRRKPKR